MAKLNWDKINSRRNGIEIDYTLGYNPQKKLDKTKNNKRIKTRKRYKSTQAIHSCASPHRRARTEKANTSKELILTAEEKTGFMKLNCNPDWSRKASLKRM